jgi:dynactin complex subunit
MPTFSRRTKIIAAFIVIIVVGYGFAVFWKSQNRVPSDFTAARLQGAIIAQTIVNNSNQSTDELKAINQYDQQGDYTDALASTTDLIYQSATLRSEAVQLSAQVSQMATNMSSIRSSDAQQAALQSITSRLALINELITYSNDLDHLLTVLQARFRGVPQPNGQVSAIVDQINQDVNLINNFNAQAGQAMDKFDSIEKGK